MKLKRKNIWLGENDDNVIGYTGERMSEAMYEEEKRKTMKIKREPTIREMVEEKKEKTQRKLK